MSSRIDFTDRRIIAVYQNLAEENVRVLEHFLEQMEMLCRQHSYKPLVQFTNNVISFYEDEFRSHVRSCFESWRSSEFSIDQLALSCGAGSGAAQTGRRYMDELSDSLDGMFRRSFSRIQVDTDAPVLEAQDILRTNDEIRTLIHNAESVKDQAVSQCISRSEDNIVYSLIQPVIKNTGESICESFRSMISKVLEGTELYRMGVLNTVDAVRTGTVMDSASFSWPSYDSFI